MPMPIHICQKTELEISLDCPICQIFPTLYMYGTSTTAPLCWIGSSSSGTVLLMYMSQVSAALQFLVSSYFGTIYTTIF
jgi:hypothetical protein